MKVIDKLAQKYALNINQIRGPSKTKNLDFKNLNKGFYDDIEKNDVVIIQNQKELKKLKNISLKEFIYTNKEIPYKWKKKTNYEDDLLNLMVTNKNILTYVGMCPKEENISTKSYDDKKLINKGFSNENHKKLSNINNRCVNKKLFEKTSWEEEGIKFNSILDSEINNKNAITEEIANDNSVSKMNKIKSKNKSKNELNDKAINNILEDFKTAYPIKEKLQQLYTTTNYYNNNSNEISNNLKNTRSGFNLSNSKRKQNNNSYNRYNSIVTNGRNSFFDSIKNQQQFKRKNVFRQNVFNNLVSTNTFSVDKKNGKKRKLKIDINEIRRPFLGSDYQNFIKKVEINNPIINKNLESINYYGPYFSHCPPCYNRNLIYYKNLEINQCLDIIHHIKKSRKKNLLLDIKKSSNNVKNQPLFENNIILDTHSLKSNENND